MKILCVLLNWTLTLFFLLLAGAFFWDGQKQEVLLMLLLACVFLPPLHRMLARAGTLTPWLVRVLLLLLCVIIPGSGKKDRDNTQTSFFASLFMSSSQTEAEKQAEKRRKLIWKELARSWEAKDPRAARQVVLDKYHISEEELQDIQHEALSKKWPYAKPTPTPRPLKQILTSMIQAVARPQGNVLVELTMLSPAKAGARILYMGETHTLPAWTLAGIMMSLRDLVKALSQRQALQMVRNYEINVLLPLRNEKDTVEKEIVVRLDISLRAVEHIEWADVDYRQFYQMMGQQGRLWVHPQLVKKPM